MTNINCEATTGVDSNENDDKDLMTLKDLVEITKTTLNELIKSDSLLRDLPADVSLEEVKAQLALEHGQSMTVYVVRADGEELPVVVKHKDATVLDLKRAVQRHINWRMQRKKEKFKISWKYIWRTYQLQTETQRLARDSTPLAELGIRNRSVVMFMKRLREKGIQMQKVTGMIS